jgi:hypothetical protein
MLYREIIAVCSEIRAKHVNKAELYYMLSSYRAVNTRSGFLKFNQLMLHREIIAVCSEIRAKQVKLNYITGSVRTAQ